MKTIAAIGMVIGLMLTGAEGETGSSTLIISTLGFLLLLGSGWVWVDRIRRES